LQDLGRRSRALGLANGIGKQQSETGVAGGAPHESLGHTNRFRGPAAVDLQRDAKSGGTRVRRLFQQDRVQLGTSLVTLTEEQLGAGCELAT
jgi:hypothetical protein